MEASEVILQILSTQRLPPFMPIQHISAGGCERGNLATAIKKPVPPPGMGRARGNGMEKGGYLLSRLAGSTIGEGGLNFSVRDGKRWDTAAIATMMNSNCGTRRGADRVWDTSQTNKTKG